MQATHRRPARMVSPLSAALGTGVRQLLPGRLAALLSYAHLPEEYRELLQRRFGRFDFVRDGIFLDVHDRLEGDTASLQRMRERLMRAFEKEFGWRPADLPPMELPAAGLRLVVNNAEVA